MPIHVQGPSTGTGEAVSLTGTRWLSGGRNSSTLARGQTVLVHGLEGAMIVGHTDDHAASDYRLHGYLPVTSDRAVALRIVALVHTRGVPLLDLEFRVADTEARGEFAATIRADAPRARTIRPGLDAMIDVEDVSLCRL